MNNKLPFKLICITDRSKCRGDFLERLGEISRCGVKAVQLREKDLQGGELLKLARQLKKKIKPYTKLFINDRSDVAALAGDGVHCPSDGINAPFIERFMYQFNENFLLSRSVHSLIEAAVSEDLGFNYLIFGPVFETSSKLSYGSPQGLDKLKEVCRAVDIPVFAVGGVNIDNAAECMKAGASGVAVVSALMQTDDIRHTVRNFKRILGGL